MKYKYLSYCKIKKCNRCTINGVYCYSHYIKFIDNYSHEE